MPENLKEAIEILDGLRKYGNASDQPFTERGIQALSFAISKLKLLEQVEKGGVKKININVTNNNDLMEEREHFKIRTEGFNEAIDLCNADLVRRLEKNKLAEFINKKYFESFNQYDLKFGHTLAQAIITHLTK